MGDKKVYPHPRLAETNQYLPGIGVDGALVSEEEADDLAERGLVLRSKPKPYDPPAEPPPAETETPAEPANDTEAA